jgi:hypothetical protein
MKCFKGIVRAALAASPAGMLAIAVMHARSVNAHTNEQESDNDLAEIGLKIAPDFLNMAGRIQNSLT